MDELDLRLTWPARQDLTSLLEYSMSTWGDDQAIAYELTLIAAFAIIRRYPEIGEARPHHFSGCRVYLVERHMIYYRVEGGGILVVRILHQSRDTRDLFREYD